MKRLLVFVVLLAGCGDTGATFYRCPNCGAAYRESAFGLPRGFGVRSCGQCNVRLQKCSKEQSGWNDNVVPNLEGKFGAPD